ncbi:hypothetical protein H0B56_09920 [Haloechinothrix sp. YIM 98757]|uniref:Chromosome segregation ATPase n=1 Tax=Haloechinothrix aidingensis TaxID=2752311 RepID=A0A838A8V0_9PSEU|nr:hypothetical protein [Haloechinothrix aidingensis]MBA0125858.1 hypothetical protein [Haloechinothrix aidingensis]
MTIQQGTDDTHEPMTSAEHDGVDGARLCAFSRCRAPLPVTSGPGNRARYCQDGKTWGAKGVSCKQAGHAEELLASISSATDVVPLPVTELAEHISAAVGPAQQLVDALQQVREQLESDVAQAKRERDEAARTAAHESGLRATAEERAAEADRRAEDAEAARSAAADNEERAVAERDRAREAEHEAERAQLRAETQRDNAREQAERAQARADEVAAHAEELNQRLAATTAETATLREQATAAAERAEDERDRAERLRTDHEAALARLREEHQAELRQERERAAAELAEVRAEHQSWRDSESARHAAEIAELNRQVGSYQHEVAGLTERAETAANDLAHLRELVRSTVSEAIPHLPEERGSAEPAGQPSAERGVRENLHALLEAVEGRPDPGAAGSE